jgi:uncharacterized protein with HEPN domain
MSKRSDALLLEDISEAISRILKYTDGYNLPMFENDDRTIDAVVRNFEIIGEAANQLSEPLKDENPDVDWFKMRGLRNRIVHQYFGIDLEIIWELVVSHLPMLKEKIEAVRKKMN